MFLYSGFITHTIQDLTRADSYTGMLVKQSIQSMKDDLTSFRYSIEELPDNCELQDISHELSGDYYS